MRVSIGQIDPTADFDHNMKVIVQLSSQAAEAKSDLIIFPEESMLSADAVEKGMLPQVVDESWPIFIDMCQSLSRDLGVSIIAGGYEPSGTSLPYNTIIAVDNGALLGTYRKMHLYDAFHYQESRRVMRGEDGPLMVTIGGFNIGIVNCYDVRFPEFTRVLLEMGANVLSISAAWASGPLKEDHWHTLLRARAIENTCWVLAASLSSDDCIGHSMIVDPLGVMRASLGEEKMGLLTHDIDKDRLDHAQSIVPVLRNRRIFVSDTK
ncbi:nitrilase-related carbon-nitrogen hydrolase [Allobranchiibius huperziae]|uniref:Putative amidohydrolase n=1 Tax=Allobranchiibius huperziae TaxID=1874116 RepID=A0A853DG89_9MICO|nr:putative amidohydrolase [Allobranchiibius huperziae]